MEGKLVFFLRAATLCIPGALHAAGFSLIEQSASSIGYAYAGAAASADDASAMFFNPAALSLLDRPQLAVAVHGINLETKFQNVASVLPPAGLGALPAGRTNDDAGGFIAVPNAYFAWPLSGQLAFGFGLNVPFGLKTEYEDPWIGRFQGLRSELKTINANPAISYRVSDFISIGAGVNYQTAEAKLSNAVMLGPGLEGRAGVDVDDDAWGWNAGVIFTLPTATRLGISYRSELDYSLEGDTTVSTLDGTVIPTASGPTTVDITFPNSIELSAVQPLSESLELRGDAFWTNWSTVGSVSPVDPATGLQRDVLNFAFEDTTRIALGLSYRQSEQWTWRVGVAWDESPVRDEVRTVRLPDGDRKWVTIGARWSPTDKMLIDAGYAHLFVDDTSVNLAREQLGAPPSFASVVVGGYDNAVDILSVQLTWKLR